MNENVTSAQSGNANGVTPQQNVRPGVPVGNPMGTPLRVPSTQQVVSQANRPVTPVASIPSVPRPGVRPSAPIPQAKSAFTSATEFDDDIIDIGDNTSNVKPAVQPAGRTVDRQPVIPNQTAPVRREAIPQSGGIASQGVQNTPRPSVQPTQSAQPRPSATIAKTETPVQPQQPATRPSTLAKGTSGVNVATNSATNSVKTQSTPILSKPETKTGMPQKTVAQAPVSKASVPSDKVTPAIQVSKDPNRANRALFIVVDKPIDGMIEYFRQYGVNVSNIFSNIKDARDTLIMQVEPCRIVIIDTGSGRFISSNARKSIIDLLGASEDGENTAVVFYSDIALKTEVSAAKGVNSKGIEWVPYKCTVGVLAYLLKTMNGYNYISDASSTPNTEYAKAFSLSKMLTVSTDELQLKLRKTYTQAPSQIKVADIVASRVSTGNDEDMIPAYKTILR